MNQSDISKLKTIARNIRIRSLLAIYYAESGHPGGSLSCADLLAYLFFHDMNIALSKENYMLKDRFILSKGHAVPALYAVGVELGLLTEDELKGLRQINNQLQGHPHRGSTPWVEASTGSLGQGFSFGIGEAMGFRHQGINNRIFVMIGDGELQEGEIWEGAMCAGHHKLDNLFVIIDYNKMQSDDLNENIMGVEPLADKWKAFNWKVIETDGHQFEHIHEAFQQAHQSSGKPVCIIAHTLKGKDVSYMEGSPLWHGSAKLSDEDISQALSDLHLDDKIINSYIHER